MYLLDKKTELPKLTVTAHSLHQTELQQDSAPIRPTVRLLVTADRVMVTEIDKAFYMCHFESISTVRWCSDKMQPH